MTVLAAFAAGFRGTFAVLSEIALAALVTAAVLPARRTIVVMRAGCLSAVAMLAALSASFGRQLAVLREAALLGWYVLAALAAGLGGARRIVLEIPPLAWPPLLAISRRFCSSIEAKPRFEVWDWSRSAIITTPLVKSSPIIRRVWITA